jgi:hypothetical protein
MNENNNLIEAAKAQALALEITIAAAGDLAFRTGKARVPAIDIPVELANPRNLRAWLSGWDRANIAVVVSAAPVSVNCPVEGNELMAFVQAVQNNIVTGDRVSYPNLPPVTMSATRGQKFARVVTSRNADGSDRSVYCFVELSTGDIYGPAGWKAPAKHARGNIRQGDQSNWWNGTLNAVGVRYLR